MFLNEFHSLKYIEYTPHIIPDYGHLHLNHIFHDKTGVFKK